MRLLDERMKNDDPLSFDKTIERSADPILTFSTDLKQAALPIALECGIRRSGPKGKTKLKHPFFFELQALFE